MPLPESKRPTYEVPLPNLEAPLVFQPFTMADKRNLLSAISFKDPKSFIRTVVDIVERHTNLRTIAPTLPLHYIELAFLEVYARSTGGVIEADYTCDAIVHEKPEWPTTQLDSGELVKIDESALTPEELEALNTPVDRLCGHVTPIRIPLEGTTIDHGDLAPAEDHVVKFPDGTFIVLGVPGWDVMKRYVTGDSVKSFEIGDDFVFECVKAIGDAQRTYTKEDFTKEEFAKWVDDLGADVADLIQPFFANIPVVTKVFDVKCPKCQAAKKIVLRGVDDFFV